MMLMWWTMQGNGRSTTPGSSGVVAFGSFVSGAAPASVAASTKPLHTISEARPVHQATMPDSYYADNSPTAAAAPQASLAFSSKRISTGTFNIFPSARKPTAATRPRCAANAQPRQQHSSVAPEATCASTGPLGGAALREDGQPQQFQHRHSVATAVTAALVASAMVGSVSPKARQSLDREHSMHSTPAAEGPQHVYESDGAPGSGSAGLGSGSPAAAARSGGAVGGGTGAPGGSATSGTTRSGTAGATYHPLNDARKEQRMVELASLLTRDHPSAGAAPAEAAALVRPDHPSSAESPLPQVPAVWPRPPDPEDAAAPLPCPAGDMEGSLYRNIAIPKPTSSSFEDRSMERSVDSSAFRVRSSRRIFKSSAMPTACTDMLIICMW